MKGDNILYSDTRFIGRIRMISLCVVLLITFVAVNFGCSLNVKAEEYCTVTLMDYEGKNLIAVLKVPGEFEVGKAAKYFKDNGYKDIPRGIKSYTWYKKPNGTKEDKYSDFLISTDLTLYGKPVKEIDYQYLIDVSDGKKMVLKMESEKVADIPNLIMGEGLSIATLAAYGDEKGIDMTKNEYDTSDFSQWRSGNTFYLSGIPADKMSKNEKYYADALFDNVNICSHVSTKKSDDALCSMRFVQNEVGDGKEKKVVVSLEFEAIKDSDKIESGYVSDFGPLTLKGGIDPDEYYDDTPIPLGIEEDGSGIGYKSIKIQVKYGKTPDPEDDSDITKLIPYAENIPVEEKEKVIKKTNTDKKDVAGSNHKYYMLKGTPKGKNSIKLTWKSIKGADGYIVYGAKCGKKLERIAEIKNGKAKSYTVKKLKKGTYYKYMLLAYKTTSKGDKVILVSKTVHIATDGGKKGNPTAIKLKKSKISVKKGKKASIKASFKKKKKVATHIGPFRYESENPAIAKVDKKGKIKGVSKGKTNILVFTQNGICKKVKVTVK